MNKMLLMIAVAAVLIVGNHNFSKAQETVSGNKTEDISDSAFLADFKKEIAEQNIIDNKTIQELNALVGELDQQQKAELRNEQKAVSQTNSVN